MSEINKIYEEVTTPCDSKTKPKFPERCPVCSASTVDLDRTPGTGHIRYACGGDYTPKPQIQNHTDKWWGVCGRV